MTNAELLSNVLAIIALLASIIGWYRDKKAEKRAHEFDLFQNVYQEFLIKRLPEARDRICITSDGKDPDTDGLINELHNLRKASIYYKYAEPQFFLELRNKLWELEDYLVTLPDNLRETPKVIAEQTMNKCLQDIYKCILKKF